MRRFLLHGMSALAGLLFVPALLPADAGRTFQEWQALEVRTGLPVGFEELASQLAASDVIYIGEEHRHRSHIEAALTIIRSLLDRNRLPLLGLEMFGWDGQAGLDHYLADPEVARDRFLQESRWKENWGGAYDEYEPLVSFARARKLPVIALNPPKPLVRRVAREGLLRAREDPEMARWGMRDEPLSDDPAYREVILKQLRRCHGGLSEDAYRRMYEGAMFRDEGMAKTIAESLARLPAGAGPVVSYTGGGHIQYRLPVPNRVLRRQGKPLRQTTVYLVSLEPGHEEEIQNLLREAIADYLWLTPLSTHGPAPRCG